MDEPTHATAAAPVPAFDPKRGARMRELLGERVLCLDGATGTWLQGQKLGPSDFGGEALEGCNEILVDTRPDLILEMHRSYLRAGADIVETDTFGGTPLVLGEYGLAARARELNRRAAGLARQACAEFDSVQKPRFVAGSMGPSTRAISVTGGITFDELVEHFYEQSRGLVEGGVDYLLVETCQDTRNIKAALVAIQRLEEQIGHAIETAVSGTIEPMGTMLAGQSAEALCISVAHRPLLYVGLNCATGPAFMADHVRALAELAKTSVACVPNAGLPDEDGNYGETPAMIAQVLRRFAEHGWLNLVGGCCGTRPAHIEALSELARGARPRPVQSHRRALYSGIDWIEATDDNRPLMVGERTNVIGSRKFKELVRAERWEEAAEVGRAQVKSGAGIVDVCLADPDRDELADVERFLAELIKKVKAPIMIDSTDARVVARALTFCQGKAIINSVNLEDGEERFERIAPLARRFGAALVVGCIDDDPVQGMAVTRQRKLEVARRSADLLVRKYGIPIEDLVFDPLVFPCATGDKQYLGSALETVEGVRLVKEEFPDARTILGISNVSFGLPPAGREVLNSVFLYECTRAGLDLAIVNSEKIERYASIPEEERKLAEDVLFRTSDETVARFTAQFRASSGRARADVAQLPLDERLARYVVEGTKEGLLPDLDLAMKERRPLDIINGPLMAGMDEVGRLFNDNKLIVAEVLQSAEVMKAAVSHLEPHMEKSAEGRRGKLVLATVKGDVHDIGKNLVEIILGNNGWEVVNLGIKVPPQEIIEAVTTHDPDVVGLSGLLVKSAQMMVTTAEEMSARGCTPDLLVGGAALTRSFVRKRIAKAYAGTVLYAQDAMDGLQLANRLVDAAAREGIRDLVASEEERFRDGARAASGASGGAASGATGAGADAGAGGSSARARPAVLDEVPQPPDFDRHVLRSVGLDEVWAWINPKMLFGKHLGLKGDIAELLEKGDARAQELMGVFEALRREARDGAMIGRGVWQWFEAEAEGDELRLFRRGDRNPELIWTLPRSDGGTGIALPDYVWPPGRRGAFGLRDSVCLMAVTFGDGVRARAEDAKRRGEYVRSHALQALALEAAEGLAEWLHARIRGQWGFADAPETPMQERWKARYRGKRYSPGYPACPDLALQEGIWSLLRPQEIGIELTEGHMMDPEASVSAMVLQHPEARYFAA
jgi:5-methyltetrahydrofolate--homocysteine methyltransferase